MYFFLKFFKNEENLKKNTSTSGCIEKYISLVKMYKKIRNRKIELKKKDNKKYMKNKITSLNIQNKLVRKIQNITNKYNEAKIYETTNRIVIG